MPVEIESLLVFLPIALALNLTPGADMFFCLGQGIKNGPGAGLASSLGIATGSFIHALLAGLGLAALISSNPVAYEIIRWSGVCYLLWLAFSSLKKPGIQISPGNENVSRNSSLVAWRNGIFVCLLNPKVALFILALVPQFVDPAKGHILTQFLIYGMILNIGGTVINGVVGIFAGTIGKFLISIGSIARMLQYFTSFVFVCLAARLALDRR